MTPVAQKLITVEEFMSMPDPMDGSLQELVRGRVITMPPPQGPHGVVCSNASYVVNSFVRPKNLGWVTTNDTGFISARGPDTVRGPDVAFWSILRCPQVPTGYFEIPPDLAIEVVSPHDTHSRILEKVREYLKRGVKLVWVIDPDLRIVTVYRSKELSKTLENGDMLSGEDVLPGFECPVSSLFA